ncbi:DUF1716-domain-containing protein [Fomitiporia mediterranea MF3/22]|uniref:DUF1716-domain-containing protein n=1 Tax=Fomitiporia mediterranea (strain MF3/22) TaxID=694068 RepID=UPI000440828E|nr:DUF1716-domain-containing protein [Fomitiporia mediterranea MF3/22]EJD01453.1 DUF1716-domain-containing protein [Fomitiporia mediterranea MF3/22]
MDIDKLFKAPKLPIGGNKRRMPEAPTPEMLKRMKVDAPESSNFAQPAPPELNGSSSKGKARATTIEDAAEEDADVEVSEDFAPGNDADYFAEEDEEGRFFGGGLTAEQKTILNIFDKAGGEGTLEDDHEGLTITRIRRMLLRFERAVDKNQDQRSKYPDDPSKFIDSEADLDSSIKSLLPLSQEPVLAYPELVKSGVVAKLVGLLSHENADIMIDVVQLINELIDEDAGAENEDEEDEGEGREGAIKSLVNALLEQSILELLVDNLPRLNESEEADRQGVFDILGIFESILGINPELGQQVVSKTTIILWLLKRIEAKTHDGNRTYAAEILSILLDNRPNRLAYGKADGIESSLKVLSQYRRRNSADADEEEFMENVFDVLCASLQEPECKKLFLEAEGIDLMVLMLKDKKDYATQCIKVLDFAMSGPAGTACCETFVEALGLKSLFSAFMGKSSKKGKSNPSSAISDSTGHILGVLSSLFTNLPSDSTPRMRLLAKFVENTYEKVDRLLDLREGAVARLAAIDRDIASERAQMWEDGEEIGPVEEDRWYLRRLEGGLYTLQTVDYVLAWVCMEDDGARTHAQQMLKRKGRTLQDVVSVLKVFRDNVDEEGESSAAAQAEDASPPQKEILGGLIAFLEAC